MYVKSTTMLLPDSTQPCRVWCHLIGSELIRNKGQFPDGTPCGYDAYCVGGQCLALSCDNKALVEQPEDCPRLEGRSVHQWEDWYERIIQKFINR